MRQGNDSADSEHLFLGCGGGLAERYGSIMHKISDDDVPCLEDVRVDEQRSRNGRACLVSCVV